MSASTSGSNVANRITELRKRILANKGKVSRAMATARELEWKAHKCLQQIELDKTEIKAMGGVVK